MGHTEMASSIVRDVATAIYNEILENPSAAGSPSHLVWTPPEEILYGERFDHTSPTVFGPFRVSIGLRRYEQAPLELPEQYQLGINISAEELAKDARPNAVFTFLVHAPGKLAFPYYRITADHQPDFESLLSIAQDAMYSSLHSLKEGDVLNLVTVDQQARIRVKQWHFAEEDCAFVSAVGELGHFPHMADFGALSDGLNLAYEVATDTYDPAKINHLILISQLPETGAIDSQVVASHASINGSDGIRFSAFNLSRFGDVEDVENLIELTELGGGSYSSVLTPADAKRTMTAGFGRFFPPAATDYEIILEFPDTLEYSEPPPLSEPHISYRDTGRFSYGASQFFLQSFSGSAEEEERFRLRISYTDASGARQTASIESTVAQLLDQNQALLQSANLLVSFVDLTLGELSCAEFFASTVGSIDVESEAFHRHIDAINTVCPNEK